MISIIYKDSTSTKTAFPFRSKGSNRRHKGPSHAVHISLSSNWPKNQSPLGFCLICSKEIRQFYSNRLLNIPPLNYKRHMQTSKLCQTVTMILYIIIIIIINRKRLNFIVREHYTSKFYRISNINLINYQINHNLSAAQNHPHLGEK